MKVPLTKIYRGNDVKDTINKVINSGRYVKGPEVKAFEREFAEYIGTDYAVAVNSGTSALLLAYKALGVNSQTVVGVPSFTFMATVEPLLWLGARLKFYDLFSCQNYTVWDEKEKVKLDMVVPVHLYGYPVETWLRAVTVEDCCQAHGAEYQGSKVGSMGTAGCFSFFPSKNMSVLGEGGMVTTDSQSLYHSLLKLRDHGRDGAVHSSLGLNFRMAEIPAAVGRVHLKHLDDWNTRRRKIAHQYMMYFGREDRIFFPYGSSYESEPVYHLCVVQIKKNRAQFREFLSEHGIETGIHYPVPCHQQPIIRERCGPMSFPITELVTSRIVSLPISPFHTSTEIEYVIEIIKEYLELNE